MPAEVASAVEAAARKELTSVSYLCRRALVADLRQRGLLEEVAMGRVFSAQDRAFFAAIENTAPDLGLFLRAEPIRIRRPTLCKLLPPHFVTCGIRQRARNQSVKQTNIIIES